jgi:glycerophosphoryl diester phosphodiesterase
MSRDNESRCISLPAQTTISHAPLIIGHRGASAVAPENTLAAFARAFADDAGGIEFDVRLARDGVPVVIHDATLRRTGLKSGAVAKMTSAQLSEIDVGSWFNRIHPHLAHDHYSIQRVPTLEEVFTLCRDKPGAIYIEMKTEAAASTEDLAQTLGELIKLFEFENRAVVVSFNLEAIATIKALDASIRTGALFAPARGGKGWRAEEIIKAAHDSGAHEILLHRLLARPKLIAKAIDANLPIVVWTVDDSKWVSRAETFGIHALITNNPANLLKIR